MNGEDPTTGTPTNKQCEGAHAQHCIYNMALAAQTIQVNKAEDPSFC